MFSTLWNLLRREPVRAHLYTLGAGAVTYCVLKGYIHEDSVPWILGVLAAVLGVENLRGKVSPADQPSVEPAPVEQPPAQ